MEEPVLETERPAPGRVSSRLWQILLLVPLPPLSLLYLHLVRAGRVAPSFLPVIALAILPIVSIVLAARRLGATPAKERPLASEIALVAIAITELAWALVSAAAVGMAIGLQSG